MAYVRGCQWRWHKELEVTTGEAFNKATAYLSKARENSSSMTKVAASQISLYDNEHSRAFTEAAQAIALDSNDPEAQLAMGLAMITNGKPKAGLEFVLTAIRLNPSHPTHYSLALAIGYFSMNDMERAVSTLDGMLKRDLSAVDLAPLLAASYAHLGRRKEALAALRLWKPGANDAVFRKAHEIYHFPYHWEISQDKLNQKLSDGLVLAGLPDDMNVEGLRDKLRQGGRPERIEAVKSLAVFGALSVDAIPDLIAALEDENNTLRRNAIKTLGRIGPPAIAALPALEALRDKKIAVYAVRRAIRNIRDF